MSTRSTQSLLRDRALASFYRRAVQHRSPGARVPEPPTALLQAVSDELGDSRLVELFIESQFNSMPEAWCIKTFKVKYPPARVCFGGKCWMRYVEYTDAGVRKPCVEKS